jgi:hypothetical protein
MTLDRDDDIAAITARIVAFLRGIGLDVAPEALRPDTFLPGLRIVGGTLRYDAAALRHSADLLHEAGHLAIAPAAIRPLLDDALGDHADPVTEVEAIAWSYAACRELGLPIELLFHADGYNGRADGLRATFGAGVYPGAHGLAARGMTTLRRAPGEGAPGVYPRMLRWLAA